MPPSALSLSKVFLFAVVIGMALCPDAGANTATITEYPVSPPHTRRLLDLTFAPDGALWFLELDWEADHGLVAQLTSNGSVAEYVIPKSLGPGATIPGGIANGPDGALWFTEIRDNQIGRIVAGGAISEYNVPTSFARPDGIVAGPDGALWFTENLATQIGRMTTSGEFIEYSVPTALAFPRGITVGPDGALWFTELDAGKAGRITISGSITEYLLPPGSSPVNLTTGPDGALWLTDANARIVRITTAGAVTAYPLLPGSRPQDIAVGPDGALWFTDQYANKVSQITTNGTVTDYPLPSRLRYAQGTWGIVTGPDGAIWFTESDGEIGRLLLTPSTITELISFVENLPALSAGEKNSGVAKLIAAQSSLSTGHLMAGCNQLEDFINDVQAMRQSRRINPLMANVLISGTNAVEGTNRCSRSFTSSVTLLEE